MKTVSKKLFSLLLVAVLLVSVLPFQAFASGTYSVTIKFLDYNWDGSHTYSVVKTREVDAPTMINGIVPTVTAPTGWRFVGWVENANGLSFEEVNSKSTIDLMKYFCTSSNTYAPKFVKDTYTVSFETGKGLDNPKSMTVTNKKVFSEAGAFPFPEGQATGYTFGGWQYGDTVLTSTNWNTVKFTSGKNITLKAVWIPDTVRATFYKWNSSTGAYETHKHVEVKYGEYVKAYDVPEMSAVNTKPYYDAIGWQTTAGEDAVAVDPTTVQIKGQTNFYARYLGDVVTITLDYKTDRLENDTKTVRIGEKLGSYSGSLPVPVLTGYTFTGWQIPGGAKVDNDTIFWNSYSKLEATWAQEAQVRLLVYKDGDTKNPIVSRLIPGGSVGGSLDVDTIAISSYLPSGATYRLTGYFDAAGWAEYLVSGMVKTVDYVACAPSGVTEVYAMVETVSTNTNTGTGSGSGNTGSGNTNTNTPSKPADPTNPATGDDSMIVASMTVMTLSAAALVVFMQLRKRKMI